MRGVDLERVAEAHQLVGQPGAVREALVDELRGDHRCAPPRSASAVVR